MDDFAQRAWRLILHREPDEDAAGRLERGEVSPARLVRELVESREFERVELLDDGLARALAERLKNGRPRELLAPAWADERAIEIPWALARYRGEARVLDVGYAFAEPAYLDGLAALGAGELTGVDLAEKKVPGLRSVVADVRRLPFDDGAFDLAYCISTLEHVGRDNAVYSVETTQEEDGDVAALRELRRVSARVIVSVPTGERDDQGWQLQRTPEDWIAVFERAGFVVYEDELYIHTPDGWRTATLDEARGARYGEHTAGAVLLAELHPSSAGEKLRLAVRDVRHRGEIRRSTSA
ncbi:MAG TPA: class I SAM-dependent methyltransferase [Gaiellaceae bacterium]